MPALHALLVAINHYPNPKHELQGCVNDMEHLRRYLESYCSSMGYTFRPRVLTDEAATRVGVIEGFDHYSGAAQDDCCLFYFSGHGSRCAAPAAFHHLEADHQLESIVLHDSRTPGGRDLMDKELSFLIWRASQGIDLPFVTIMDCCHSGRMRDINDTAEVLGSRTVRDIGDAPLLEEFLGVEHYKRTDAGELSPPLGRRVHLAAALDTELAKEIKVGDQPRGVFTHCLLEALENGGPLVSYANLLNRVNLRIRNAVREQSAQLEAAVAEDKNRGFLFSRIDAERPAWLVAWDKATNTWMLNAGAVHGIPANQGESKTLLKLADDDRIVTVEHVAPTQSAVSGMKGGDTRRAYIAYLDQLATPKMRLAFAPGSDPDGVEHLRSAILRRTTNQYALEEGSTGAGYLVHAREGAYFLSRTHNEQPLFERVGWYSPESALTFLKKLDAVATWQQLLEWSNPGATIRESEITLYLHRVTDPGNYEDNARVEEVDWQSGPAVFPYTRAGNEDFEPAFQLKIKNSGSRKLWVSLLYLSSDFGITNALIPKLLLEPGQEAWALDKAEDYEYRTIPLRIDDERLSSVDEFFKLLICTDELNTDTYNQEGLKPDQLPHRALGLRERPRQRDWTEKVVGVRVVRG